MPPTPANRNSDTCVNTTLPIQTMASTPSPCINHTETGLRAGASTRVSATSATSACGGANGLAEDSVMATRSIACLALGVDDRQAFDASTPASPNQARAAREKPKRQPQAMLTARSPQGR